MKQTKKFCSRCLNTYPLTTEYFYPARKIDRKKVGWQSYCKLCWKDINATNKQKRKEMRKDNILETYFGTGII